MGVPKRRRRRPRSGTRRTSDPWRKRAARRAARFVDHYEKQTGRRLDMSLDRVRDLDRYLEKHFESDPLPEELIESAGFFFAEVWRRNFGGRYVWDKERESLAIRDRGVSVYPIEKVSRTVQKKTQGALEAFAFIYARKRADP